MSEATDEIINSGEPAPEPSQFTWSDHLDESSLDYVTRKNVKDVGSLVKSYRNLERKMGGAMDLVEIPGADADEDRWNQFYEQVGRPSDPLEYGFKDAESTLLDADREFLSKTAFENGLSMQQAKNLFSSYSDYVEKMVQSNKDSIETHNKQAVEDLKTEWGRDYDANLQAGRRAAIALGYDDESLAELEETMGPAPMIKLLANLGHKIGEPGFIDDEPGGGFGMKPEVARDLVQDFKADPQKWEAYMRGEPSARRKYRELMAKAFPNER